jgi:flavin reductase (DIM6/NTAB) family NADH-FMN oxidoreductase RutF
MSTVEIGTHRVLYGAVEHVFVAPAGSPLVYSSRSYGTVARLANLDR